MSEDSWDELLLRRELIEESIAEYLTTQSLAEIWVSNDGVHTPIKDMKYEHLINAYRMVERMGEEGNRWMYHRKLKNELRRRANSVREKLNSTAL